MSSEKPEEQARPAWGRLFGKGSKRKVVEETKSGPAKWSMGVLNDRETVEVPGSVLLLAADRNEPLGLRNVHARTSHSSIPAGFYVDAPLTPSESRHLPHTPPSAAPSSSPHYPSAASNPPDDVADKKKTEDGAIILDPQPEESANDPLNWPSWQRDVALLSLGFYCMIGGGITPVLAAGFQNVADTFNVAIERVSLTTGLYMMGLGVGSVVASPTAILWGKRPVYLTSAIIFIGTSLWAAWSPSFTSLLVARVFQGMAVSPVECLPSATIAEIFFLHERAFRIGIYTLLLLSGKNLVPLVSAAIIGRFGWRWAFWIVAMVVGLGFVLLFLFVPETFWDRTPSRKQHRKPSFLRRISSRPPHHVRRDTAVTASGGNGNEEPASSAADHRKALHVGFTSPPTAEEVAGTSLTPSRSAEQSGNIAAPGQAHQSHHSHKDQRVGFAESLDLEKQPSGGLSTPAASMDLARTVSASRGHQGLHATSSQGETATGEKRIPTIQYPEDTAQTGRKLSTTAPSFASASMRNQPPPTPASRAIGSPYRSNAGESTTDVHEVLDPESISASALRAPLRIKAYTHNLRHRPQKSFVQHLRPYHGRLTNDKWLKVMVRPFILYAYPAVLWSSAVYACSIGWLIVISETISLIFRNKPYSFTPLQTGLVYVSPFIGGILGTLVAGKISDIIVKAMARRNGGLYEPEFRLVMAIPVTITTCIGLMGFGWSAQLGDHWIIPTFFFGIVSFGCSLGSTTSITFCVDSYRQYAGEALVTLNFSKNIIHGLVFSLFVTDWLADDGAKTVYIWLGVIQLLVLLTTIPMYIYGKRARMWTYRKNLMEKL